MTEEKIQDDTSLHPETRQPQDFYFILSFDWLHGLHLCYSSSSFPFFSSQSPPSHLLLVLPPPPSPPPSPPPTPAYHSLSPPRPCRFVCPPFCSFVFDFIGSSSSTSSSSFSSSPFLQLLFHCFHWLQ